MNTLWATITWNVARTGGFTAYILLTISVALGLALTMHWQTPRWPRIINNELHNFITLLALIFTGVHVLAVTLDPFTHFGLNEILLPFVSHYRPVWMALGIVALYLGLAIGLSTWIRPIIGYKWWRRMHVLTLLIFGLTAVHGIATGSDTRTWFGAIIYASSILLVGSLLWLRLYKPANAQSKGHPVLAGAIVAVILAGTAWAALGPFEPGWNALANNGNGSGGTVATTTTAQSATSQKSSTQQQTTTQPSTQSTFAPSFTGNLQGQLKQRGPDSNGNVTLHLTMNIVNGPQGVVQVVLQGQSSSDGSIQVTGSQVTLSDATGTPLYTGQLTSLDAQNQWNMTALLQGTGSAGSESGKQLQVQMQVQIDNTGQSTGSISGTSAVGTQPETETGTSTF